MENILENFRIKDYSTNEDYFSEAVFADGKKTVAKIEEAFKALKAKLEMETEKQKSEKGYKFDPNKFWKDETFKNLENAIQDAFGFRMIILEPFIENYNAKTGKFDSQVLNAFVYTLDRYPIEGILTDKGFYDKSKSVYFHMVMSLGIIKELEEDELTAVLLHEIGHGIDPALVTISYSDTNVLTKYLTDRKDKLTDKEKKRVNSKETFGSVILGYLFVLGVYFGIVALQSLWAKIQILVKGKEWYDEKRLKQIKEKIKKDKDKFDRVNAYEAYADNFARMYGYAVPLHKGLKKLSIEIDKHISRTKLEVRREKLIIDIINYSIKDEHKTDMHRIKAVLKEYEDDLKDPTIPKQVKKQMEDDKKELELLLESYTKDFDKFQNKVNQAIIEELERKEKKGKDKENKNK